METYNQIIEALQPLVASRGYLPSKQELESISLGWLSSSIQRHGGFRHFQNVFNVKSKKPNKKRSDEDVEKILLEISSSIGKMPSNSYLQASGFGWMSSWISKNGGFVGVSNRLNLQRGHSDSDTGWEGEKRVQSILEDNGFKVERSAQIKSPFDLLVNHLVKIDVKTSSMTTRQNSQSGGSVTGWFYRIGKVPQSDLIALFCMDTNDMFLIPWNSLPHTNVTLSQGGGKYRKYLNRFDLLSKLCDLRRDEMVIWQ